jgi:hypothetical protein
MAAKADPQLGVGVDTGDRLVGAGCKDADGKYDVPLVDNDGHLQVDVLSGGGGGTQYTEGDTDASLTGTIALAEGPSDTATPLQVDSSKHLQVDIAASSATVTVDGSGVTQPVSNAGLTELAAAIDTEVQCDIVGSLPAGTNAIGKLSANSGVDIGDVDVTSIANGSINGPGAPTIDSYTHKAINLTTGANQVLASSAANKQIWVYGYQFTCGDAAGQTVSFQDEDDTALSGIMEFAQYGGASVSPSGNFAMPIWKLGTDKDLEVDITGGDVDGWIAYAVVSV